MSDEIEGQMALFPTASRRQSPLQRTPEDTANQAQVARVLERAWDCRLLAEGPESPVTHTALRGDQPVALIKIRCRTVPAHAYPSTWLSHAQWRVLRATAKRTGRPVLYVVGFTDSIRWISIMDVDGAAHAVQGRAPRAGMTTDIEKIIDIPIEAMAVVP